MEALLELFALIGRTGRLVFIVAQHMAKDGHDDLMARLLSREAILPVALGKHGDSLQPDTITILPSGSDGIVEGHFLKLAQPRPGNWSTPSVNVLFDSLAQSHRTNALGIVLSGTGSDGTKGCLALRSSGAKTIVQDPTEAKYDGMPSSVIAARAADHILSIEGIAEELGTLFPMQFPTKKTIAAPPPLPQITPDFSVMDPAKQELQALFPLIHRSTGIDFTQYKEETLLRRLEKRKTVLGLKSAAEYQAHIQANPQELQSLQHQFLVSVSSFFRDRDSFMSLQNAFVPILKRKQGSHPIHVWVPGCASGEECYSLAILVAEALGESVHNQPIQIIGTDLNHEALSLAEAGLYRQSAFQEMEPLLLERYFTPNGQNFQIADCLRKMVKFERRDVMAGSPCTQLDLVSCRNLLIYLKPSLQDHLIAAFHRAMAPQSLLFIGQSESLTFMGNSLFTPIDSYHRLFQNRG